MLLPNYITDIDDIPPALPEGTSLGGFEMSGVKFVGRDPEYYIIVLRSHDLPTGSNHDWDIDFQQGTDTTVVVKLPEKISVALDRFTEGDFNRLEAYEHAESVVELLEDDSGPWEYALALRIPQLNENRRGTLYGALADCEVRILNPDLLNRIADDIGSENKSLAQSAAACLYWCGSEAGRQILMEKLESKETIPHRPLIVSLMKLLR